MAANLLVNMLAFILPGLVVLGIGAALPFLAQASQQPGALTRLVVFVLGLTAATAIGAAPALVYDASVGTPSGIVWWGLCAFGLGLLAPIHAAASVALGCPVAVVLVEGSFGNLGPIAVAVALVLSGVPAAVGAFAAFLVWFLDRRLAELFGRDPIGKLPWAVMATVLTTLAVGLAYMTARRTGAAMLSRETAAIAKVEALWRAQEAARANAGAYACVMEELDVAFEGPRRSADGSVQDRGYWFRLSCPEEDSYWLLASPVQIEGKRTARMVYCVDEAGELRVILAARGPARCFESGEVVARLRAR